MKTTAIWFLWFSLLAILKNGQGRMEPFIVGGSKAKITQFPHSAFLLATCGRGVWCCGASVLNQKILLTAAHCLENCALNTKKKNRNRVSAFLGAADVTKSIIRRKMSNFIQHKMYNEFSVENDICLVKLKRNLPLGNSVKRVIVSQNFYNAARGYVAGWGSTCETNGICRFASMRLKYVYQKLRSIRTCAMLTMLHPGMFCAGTMEDGDHAANGDSGSALVNHINYQQLGIVSFRMNRVPAMMVYTNVSYYYTWIVSNAKKLYCNSKFRG